VDAEQCLPRKRSVEPVAKQTMQRADGEWANPEAPDAFVSDCPLESRQSALGCAHGDEQMDGAPAEPPQGEQERVL
jgi:hypothetical protein